MVVYLYENVCSFAWKYIVMTPETERHEKVLWRTAGPGPSSSDSNELRAQFLAPPSPIPKSAGGQRLNHALPFCPGPRRVARPRRKWRPGWRNCRDVVPRGAPGEGAPAEGEAFISAEGSRAADTARCETRCRAVGLALTSSTAGGRGQGFQLRI